MFTEFLVALQFLTIVRLRATATFEVDTLGRAGAFFPLVGLLLGTTLWGIDKLLAVFAPFSLVNIVLIAALVGFTRGLHLDGVADSADGLWGSMEKQRSLRIMKDSRIGTFGALALIGVLVLKLRALDLLLHSYRAEALILGPMFGRWACIVMAYAAPPAREDGLGALFIRGVGLRELLMAGASTCAVSLCCAGLISALLFVVLTAGALGITHYCQRRLDGVTGDTMGAVGELVETAAFCLFAVWESGGGGKG